jgi:hypothetical protein
VITLIIEHHISRISLTTAARVSILFLFLAAALNYSLMAFKGSPVDLFEAVEHNHGGEGESADFQLHDDDHSQEEDRSHDQNH